MRTIPRHRRLPSILLPMLALAASALHASPPDAVDTGWILQRLAQPAPMRTGFVELRGSRLLKAPLRVEGEYQRPDADTLVRVVHAPFVERSTIRSGNVTIERGGKGRTYSLDRAPELAGLQSSFGALLDGDRALLDRHFRIDSSGTRQRWTLTLVPRDAAMAARVRDLVLHGRGAELRCIETRPVKGDVQRTLLADAAKAAAGVTQADALAALCRGDASGQ